MVKSLYLNKYLLHHRCTATLSFSPNSFLSVVRMRLPLTFVVCLSLSLEQTQAWLSADSSNRSSTTRLHGVGGTLRRARDSLLDRERSREDLKIGIAGFYDRSSKLWEDVWGEVRLGRRAITNSLRQHGLTMLI